MLRIELYCGIIDFHGRPSLALRYEIVSGSSLTSDELQYFPLHLSVDFAHSLGFFLYLPAPNALPPKPATSFFAYSRVNLCVIAKSFTIPQTLFLKMALI